MLLTSMGRGPKVALLAAVTLTFLLILHIISPSAWRPTWRLPTTTAQTGDGTSSPPPAAALQQHDHTSGKFNPQQASQQAWSHYDPNDSTADSSSPRPKGSHANKPKPKPKPDLAPCQKLEGGEDVLVVMRTGATEIKDKLPVHFNTTFKCYPNYIIFSDYEEDFHGHQVHDVLKYIPDEIKTTNVDFQHYMHVQEVGRQGLDKAELSGQVSEESGPVGKLDNAGWNLDKWKFLPMANETLARHPDKNWFVFVEPDSYLVWSSFLQWIPKLDPSKPLYVGSEVMIGGDIFAHGGSVFLLSKPAMEKLAKVYNHQTAELHEYTAGHWAGDCVLGKTLHDAGVDLTWGFPMFQGGNPSISMDWDDGKGPRKLWCTPAMSYHHFIPSEIDEFWHFEQRWIEEQKRNSHVKSRAAFSLWPKDMSGVLHHRDTFKQFVLPKISSELKNWDNTPDWIHPDTMGMKMKDCRELCRANSTCQAYSTSELGCSIGPKPYTGRKKKGVSSGWLMERIEAWQGTIDRCSGQDRWVTD
ncbi:glycosyltransferase family 31 [Lecanosticta acicola]|uniref:Glycosyltransferase family 31 n=1 Tax=Lecanosticta acicola TaxID=111012 RepID=A0AAI8YWU5_9PEZI|nr:glycosyltransferase family 31 [Lecanosticta acicola]